MNVASKAPLADPIVLVSFNVKVHVVVAYAMLRITNIINIIK